MAFLGIVIGWALSGPVLDFSHGWVDSMELVVALVTFLMVAVLQNESWRGSKATQRKLNAMAAALDRAVTRARAGEGPTFIEALTYRLGAHSSSDDPTRYRDETDWMGTSNTSMRRFLVRPDSSRLEARG